DVSEAFETFFKAIQISDPNNIVNYFLKNFCTDEQTTSDNINRFIFVLKIKSKQIKLNISNNENKEVLKSDIELFKKSLIILGTLSRYVKYSSSFSIYLSDIIENLLLPHFIDESSDDDTKMQVLSSYTSLLQCYEDTIESYSLQFIEYLQKSFDINKEGLSNASIKTIIDFIVILMQASPLLVIKNNKIIESLIKIYCSIKDENLYEDLTQVLGQYFQLYLPYKSSKNEEDDDEDTDDDEDDFESDGNGNSNNNKVSEMNLENEISISLLENLSKLLFDNINKESSTIFLGILCGYTSIYIKDKSLCNNIFSSYLEILKKDNICNRENRKITVNIIDSLRIGVSNAAIRESNQLQETLINIFKVLLDCIGDIKEYVKNNLNKGSQAFFQRSRSSIILNLMAIIRVVNDFFEFSEEFLIYAPVLADPLIFSEFITSLTRNIDSISNTIATTISEEEKQSLISKRQTKISLLLENYLPKILNPLLSEIVKPIQKYKSMTIHVIKAIGNIAQSTKEFYQPFLDTTVERLCQFVAKNWKSISRYAPSIITTLDKVLKLFTISSLYKPIYLNSIIQQVYLKILNNSNSIQLDNGDDDDKDDDEEDDQQDKDTDVISKIVFKVLTSLTETLPIIKNCLQVDPNSTNITKDLYKYLIGQIGTEEVIFDADRYIRLAQLDLLTELYTHFSNNLQFDIPQHESISFKHIFNELGQIQIALELGEEELDKNQKSQRKEICLNTFKSIVLSNPQFNKENLVELLKEFINNTKSNQNDIDKHQIKKDLL
ncbi:hypothetical protein DICPUDRAFT_16141, partial [Dictyostelium purpureum]